MIKKTVVPAETLRDGGCIKSRKEFPRFSAGTPVKKILFLIIILFNQLCFADKEPPQVVLQRFDLPGTPYHHCGMSMVTFLPGDTKSRHEHTGPEVGFVLEGELILKLEGHPAKTIHAGESFQIPMHVFHTTEAGTKGAKVIATWILTGSTPF